MHPAEQFFRSLYEGQTGYIELRTFAPDTDANRRAVANRIRDFVPVNEGQFDFGRVSVFLRECERYELGAFFGVALRSQRGADEREGTGEHCQVLTAIFVDADFKHLGEDETRRRLESLGLPPSLLVRSGGGLHPYWLLRVPIYLQMPGEMARAKKLLRDFARALAGVVDESVSEPARVLRIPGSKNFKSEYGTPRNVELVAADGPRYDIADIERIAGQSSDDNANDDRSPFQMPDTLPTGDRHGVLFQLLRSLKAKGLSLDAAVAACHIENEAKGNPPLDRAKLDTYLRRSWHIKDQASFEAPPAYDAGPLVLNPQDPLPSARLFLEQRHTIDGILTLRHQGGVFYAYADDAGAYYERDEPAVRSAVYGFLEPAKRRGKNADDDDKLVPFQTHAGQSQQRAGCAAGGLQSAGVVRGPELDRQSSGLQSARHAGVPQRSAAHPVANHPRADAELLHTERHRLRLCARCPVASGLARLPPRPLARRRGIARNVAGNFRLRADTRHALPEDLDAHRPKAQRQRCHRSRAAPPRRGPQHVQSDVGELRLGLRQASPRR
jgi:hypothetical protein